MCDSLASFAAKHFLPLVDLLGLDFSKDWLRRAQFVVARNQVENHFRVLLDLEKKCLVGKNSLHAHLLVDFRRKARHEWLQHGTEKEETVDGNVDNFSTSFLCFCLFVQIPRFVVLEVPVAKG